MSQSRHSVYRRLGRVVLAGVLLMNGAASAALVSEWRMDEQAWSGVPGEVVDSVGGIDGRARTSGSSNSLPDTASAKVCRGGYFRGQGFNDPDNSNAYVQAQHYVEIPDSNALSPLASTGSISLSGWIRPGANGDLTVLHKGEGGNTQEYQIAVENQRLGFTVWNANGSPSTLQATSVNLAPGNWYYFGASADRQGNGNQLRANLFLFDQAGSLISSNSVTWGGFFGGGGGNYGNKPLTGAFVFGGERFGTGAPVNFFNGLLDEMRLHDEALNSGDFQALALQSRPCPVAGGFAVFDDFETYPPGSVDGRDGGTGWGGAWQAAGGQSIIDTSTDPLFFAASNGLSIRSLTTLEVNGNNDRMATRALSDVYTGEQIYMSMLLRFEGRPENNDFLGFWLQRPTFGESPQFGLKVNEGGSGEEDFFVRLDTIAEYSTDFQPGQTYLLVARFDKNGTSYFNEGRLWVNPQCTDSPPPTASAIISRNPRDRVSQVSELGFRTANLGGGSRVQVGHMAAGERWTDVVRCTCYQNGLEATYYNDYARSDPFPDTPVLTRLDPQVDFDWGGTSPATSVNNDNFAVQWQGAIEVPQTGMYRFRTRTDDGVRLWVDDLAFNQALIDHWTDQSAADQTSGEVYLEAGQRYAIRMQFYENGGLAVAELQWETPGGGGFGIIPESQLFACLPVSAPQLETAAGVCGVSDQLRINFAQTPQSRVLDSASAANSGFFRVEEIGSGDIIGVNASTLEASGYSVLLDLASPLASDSRYRVSVQDVQDVGGLVMEPNPATVEFEGGGTGLTTYYWNNRTLSGPTVAQQNSAIIDEDYGSGSPIPGVVNDNNFSVRWSGYLVPPVTGEYRFRTRSDDGVRLWVEDLANPVIDQWIDQAPTNHESGTITLQQGQVYALKMEMYENQGGAVARLSWDTPNSSGFEVVPASALFNCPDTGSALDHFRIISGGSAVTCSPTPVTIQATDSAGMPVTDYDGTISLSTSSGQGDWYTTSAADGSFSRGSGNSGEASYGFSVSDGGVVTLNLRHSLAGLVNVNISDGSVSERAGYDPDIDFAETGFIFHQDGDLTRPIDSIVAGKDSSANPGAQNLYLTAVRTSDQTGACETFLSGTQNIDIGYTCDNPGNCALNDALRINGQTVASNDSGSSVNTAPVSLNFGDDTSGSAPLALNYRDAGRISLFARRSLTDAEGNPTGGEMAGSSNAFVSVPAGFCIAPTSTEGACSGNPADCSVLATAGGDFSVRYQAVAWQTAGESGSEFCTGNPVTPAFAGINLDLNHELVAPLPGEPGTLEPAGVGFATGAGGTTDQFQSISEVGAFRIRMPGNQLYLGQPLPAGESDVIGRLIPARFEVTVADVGELGAACVGSPGFTYTGQDFGWQMPPELLIAALNEDGDLTTNYTRDDFQKLQAADVSRTLPTTDSSQQNATGTALLGVTVTSDPASLNPLAGSPGQMSYSFSSGDAMVYPKSLSSRVDPFYPSLTFTVSGVMDSDNVSGAPSLPLSLVPAATAELRYGRWAMENVYGPENVSDLSMPFRVEYWLGDRFVPNAADSCSAWSTTGITGTSDHHSLTMASGTLAGGVGGPLELVPDGSRGEDTLVWQMPAWLQDFWNDASTLQNPSAIATFGVYRGNDRIIYWREVEN